MTANGAKGQRIPLSFSVDGLPAREELLLKSLVRLLDHRTQQHWLWKVEQADLRIVGDHPPAVDQGAQKIVPTLTIGQSDPQHGHFLPLPLHADALEAMLNRLGAIVIHARGLGLAAPGENAAEEAQFRLLRWPPAAMLDTPVRMRLATILASRPTSLATLQQRSATTLQACIDFLDALQQAGFVERAGPAPSPRAPDAAPAATHAPAARDIAVPPGLLARIRSRLGLLPAGPK